MEGCVLSSLIRLPALHAQGGPGRFDGAGPGPGRGGVESHPSCRRNGTPGSFLAAATHSHSSLGR